MSIHLQGPVPLSDESYIERHFEREVLREILANRWVLLLGPRQHGKTSAVLRIDKSLRDSGLLVATVDLQETPPLTSYEAFVGWFCSIVFHQLQPSAQPKAFDGNNLADMISQAIPPGNTPVIVIVDEASNIPDVQWRNSFYGQLRAISSRRALSQADESAARLRFLFAGTFKPETLIAAENSPFNVCEKFESEDLSIDQVKALTKSIIVEDFDRVGELIFIEVGGQPYLVQRLLSAIDGDPRDSIRLFVDRLKTGDSDHIGHLFTKILADNRLSEILSRMVREGSVQIEATDPDYRYLQVVGIAKRNGFRLEFRNNLYQFVAGSSPQLGGRNLDQTRAPMFIIPETAFTKVIDLELREIAYSLHVGAISAYHGGSNRLALAGFGASAEAILTDILVRHPVADLPRIVSQGKLSLKPPHEVATNVRTWRLVNLIKATSFIGIAKKFEVSQALREWRNLIHAEVARASYVQDSQLAPEVVAASAMHMILLRDIT